MFNKFYYVKNRDQYNTLMDFFEFEIDELRDAYLDTDGVTLSFPNTAVRNYFNKLNENMELLKMHAIVTNIVSE